MKEELSEGGKLLNYTGFNRIIQVGSDGGHEHTEKHANRILAAVSS